MNISFLDVLIGSTLAVGAFGQVQTLPVVGHIGGAIVDTVDVEGQYAFIGEGPRLRVLDVSNTANPTPAGSILFNDIVVSVFVEGAMAFVGTVNSSHVLDVTDPRSPKVLGQIPGGGQEFAVENGRVYACAESSCGIFNVDDPLNIQLLGVYNLGGGFRDVAVEAEMMYIADNSNGLRIVDASDPANLVEIALYSPPRLRAGRVRPRRLRILRGPFGRWSSYRGHF